jgi:hypothetical protein
MKKAWKMAREAFPGVSRLYIETPRHLGCKGKCSIHDLEKNEPIGHLVYQVVSVDQKPVLKLDLAGDSASLSMPKVNQAFKISLSTEKFGATTKIDPRLMARNCSDGFELGKKVALLIADELKGKPCSRKEITTWLERNEFPLEIITPVIDGLHNLGREVSEDYFNLKTAKPKSQFIVYQRVRISNPASMEHQECGRILAAKGGGKDPEWYLVLVDGSEKPLWFPASSLDLDAAGKDPGQA